ncbi:beta-ketoacyl synthase chain length factor [Aeromonas sp. L_1B5_3]|uniref:beta-ketoacyl synthase chain length factor n=1 Tax=Aeromonas TaxID=642 RepID=UPI0005B6DD76|nr:beta-ketoacyl synthase chain length factor [Aeromonas sp. L_1B5_3]KIQ82078.1 beta-ketoacyl synthase [Aeromonas sp. L_1B5_3]
MYKNSSFSIVESCALAPGLTTREQWQEWAKEGIWPTQSPVATPHIPMMVARRMSLGSRLAVEVALDMMSRHTVEGTVFASRHGELDRSIGLLTALAQARSLSPTDFSQSVHNTAAGLTSIQGKQPIPMSSLAAGSGTFAAALQEAIGMLADGMERVLVVAFEGTLPAFSQPWLGDEPPPHAVALLLSRGDEWQGSALATDTGATGKGDALACWRALLDDMPQFRLTDGRREWLWQRN